MRSFTRTQVVLTALAGVATVTAGVFVARHSEKAHAVAPSSAQAGDSNASAPSTPVMVGNANANANAHAVGCTFADGAMLSYKISSNVTVKMDNILPAGATANNAPPPSATNAAGSASQTPASVSLDVRALHTDPGVGAVLLAKLHDADASIAQTRGDLSQPFLLRVDAQCHLAGFARLATTAIRDARGEESVAYGLQFAWPTDATGATIASAEAHGENSYGAYRATFTADVSNASTPLRTIDGRIDAYTRVWDRDSLQADANQAEQKPVASHLSIELGAGPWFQTVTATEHLKVEGADVESDLTVRAQDADAKQFDGVSTDVAKYIWEDLLPKHVHLPVTAATRTPDEKRAIAAAAHLTLPQAMENYQAGVKGKVPLLEVSTPLSHFIEAHPESAKTIASEIKSGKIKAGDAAVFTALGQATVPEARDALIGMKNDASMPSFDRARSAFALVDRSDVGVDLARSLRSDAQAITSGKSREDRLYARHAALAVGMMAGLHGDEQPDVVTEAKGTVTDILSSQDRKNWKAISPAFGTAANIGDASMLGTFVPYMVDPSPDIRREAFGVIRRMPPSATTSIAVAVLQHETDSQVRFQAYQILAMQHHDAQVAPDRTLVVQTLIDLNATPTPATLTRQSMIALLGLAVDKVPEAKAGLLAWAPHEYALRKEGVYQLLASFLSGPELTAATASAVAAVQP